jgi:RHS repeat-associated protein
MFKLSRPNTLGNTITYRYDVYDRRITKAIDSDGAGSASVLSERMVYDGSNIALTFDGNGNQTHRYLYGPGIDQILADETLTSVNWALADNQSTVRDVIDSQGQVLNHLIYDSYGQVTSETNPNFDFRYGYTGRERDKETGLNYNRARYYDPANGRFIGEDPIEFSAGDANLYRYVGNSPLNGTDPTGLYWGESVVNSYVDAGRRLIQDPGKTLRDGFEGGISLTNEAAENAQKYYAARLLDPNTSAFEKPFDAFAGMLSSLATECNLPKTAIVLGSALFASQAIKGLASKGIGTGILKASIKPIHLYGAALGGGIDAGAQLGINNGDLSKLDTISIAGSAISGSLGGALGIGIPSLGANLFGLGKNIVGRAALNSIGSAGIGVSVTLGQNIINSNLLGKSVGLLDNVGENALNNAVLGGFGSFAGDALETGYNASRSTVKSFLAQQAYKQLPLDLKGLSYSITSYQPHNLGSQLGTAFGNAVANSFPIVNSVKNR